MLKRTAVWHWEEAEWKVLVKKEGGSRRVEKELPFSSKDDPNSSASPSRMAKAKEKIKEATQSLKPSNDEDVKDSEVLLPKAEEQKQANENEETNDADDAEDVATDNDGWIYGDNQWKALSNKGGLGKVCIHHFIFLSSC